MRVLTGQVTGLRFGSKVTWWKKNFFTAVSKIDGQTVVIESPDPILVDEGEDVRAAGEMRKGALQVYAYRNITTGTTGNKGSVQKTLLELYILGGTTMLVISMIVLLASSGQVSLFWLEVVILVIASASIAGFVYILQSPLKVWQAIKAVR